jgi:hypothetical protein
MRFSARTPLAHLPSGKYAANAAWLALAVIAFNLTRAAATAAGIPKAPLGDSAPTDHRHPRPDRDHQPPSRPAPTRLLALGIGVEHAVGQHDRPALTTLPAPARPEDPMESRQKRLPTAARKPSQDQSSNQAIRRSAPVDPGSEHGQFGCQRK